MNMYYVVSLCICAYMHAVLVACCVHGFSVKCADTVDSGGGANDVIIYWTALTQRFNCL